MARIKSTIANFTTNKIGNVLDKATDYLSGITKDDKFLTGESSIKTVYPIDLFGNDRYGEMLKFTMYDITLKPETAANLPSKTITKKVSKTAPDKVSLIEEADKLENYKGQVPTKGADIYLYVPAQSMVDASQMDWETKETSSIARSELSLSSAGTIVKSGVQHALKAAGGKIAETSFKDKGVALSNNIESFFSGMGLRKFSFAFEFAPRNEAELRNALIVCRTFKKYALPVSTSDHVFKYPMAWKFAVHSANYKDQGKVLPLMGCERCYINSVTTNMSPDSVWTTFHSGHPVVWTMNLSFVENDVMERTQYEAAEYEL